MLHTNKEKKTNEKQRKKKESRSINLFEFRAAIKHTVVGIGGAYIVSTYSAWSLWIHRQNGQFTNVYGASKHSFDRDKG